MGDKKGIGFGNMGSGLVPPQPGQSMLYVCGSCGGRFTHKMPLLFDLGVKCPACGSFMVRRDTLAVVRGLRRGNCERKRRFFERILSSATLWVVLGVVKWGYDENEG